MNTKQKIIMQILERGDSIRRLDGRYKDSFVNQDALEELIKQGLAEVYKLQKMDFVRISHTVSESEKENPPL